MKTLYIECNMGAAGDMLTAALIELLDKPEKMVERLNGIGIPKVNIVKGKAVKCGIVGTQMKVMVEGIEEEEHIHHCNHTETSGHYHTGMQDIIDMISGLDIPDKVKEDSIGIYRLIAEAESHVHGTEISNIHFHEVGTWDAVADIVSVSMIMNEILPDKVVVSPIHVGSGHVHCAHGILPVPAPATSYILKDVPIYGGDVRGELCTPTGAAILKYYADGFGPMPVMKVQKTGYGMGKKDFAMANLIRIMLGTSDEEMDSVSELCCNLDDMTPESIGFATEILMENGALDVYTTSIMMKKNRPGIILTCMCKLADKEKFLQLLFKHTTTLGIREYECRRYGLQRSVREVSTEYGTVHIKTATGYGVTREKPEYEDMAGIAEEHNMSLYEVQKLL